MDWQTTNTRRIENLGDGNGPGLLVEESRTNKVRDSRVLTGTDWVASGLGTYTANAAPGPDGAATIADQHSGAATQYGPYGAFGIGSGLHFVVSAWLRRVSGSGTARVGASNGATNVYGSALSLTTIYQRGTVKHQEAGGALIGYYIPHEGRDGAAGAAFDHAADLVQMEEGHFPTSAIRTSGATVTRGADVLTYASGAYPAAFLTAGFVVEFAPCFSSAEAIADGGQFTILANNSGTELLALYVSGGVLYALLQGGGGFIQRAITFSRNQKLTITGKPTAGSLTVAGATTGDGNTTGTVGAWTAGQTLYVGSDVASGTQMNGRLLGGTGGLITEAA